MNLQEAEKTKKKNKKRKKQCLNQMQMKYKENKSEEQKSVSENNQKILNCFTNHKKLLVHYLFNDYS